jgi:membrane protein implicated in regulation of membrane protease activity
MLIVVLVLAVVGLAVLAAAILTGNTILALIVIALAAVGLLLLARDWLADRRRPEMDSAAEPDAVHDRGMQGEVGEKGALEPDLFEPDVSYEDAEEADEAEDGAPGAEPHGAARDGNDRPV